jgi:hypothetical protein
LALTGTKTASQAALWEQEQKDLAALNTEQQLVKRYNREEHTWLKGRNEGIVDEGPPLLLTTEELQQMSTASLVVNGRFMGSDGFVAPGDFSGMVFTPSRRV